MVIEKVLLTLNLSKWMFIVLEFVVWHLEMPFYLNFDMPCGTCRRADCLYDEAWCGHTSIEVEHTIPESKNNELKIFPNPVVDILTLEIDYLENLKAMNTEIEIFDMMGKTILQNKIINEGANDKLIWKVNISQFTTGLYLIRILDKEHKVVATGKFVKE